MSTQRFDIGERVDSSQVESSSYTARTFTDLKTGEQIVDIREQLKRLAKQKAMDKAKKSVDIALAQKRRLYDELERRKLLKLA